MTEPRADDWAKLLAVKVSEYMLSTTLADDAERVVRTITDMIVRAAAHAPAPPVGWAPTHQHYKGNLYQVLFEAQHSETDEPLTVYRSEDGRVWCRPTFMFNGTVMSPYGGDDKRRFAPIPTAPSTQSKE